MIIDSKNVNVGDRISFKTINAYDTNLYTGNVIGFGDYQVAKGYYDVVTMYFEIAKTASSLIPAEESIYMLVRLPNSDTIAIAVNWVEPTTLSLITVTEHQRITIYNVPADEIPTVLQLLRDNNYPCAHESNS